MSLIWGFHEPGKIEQWLAESARVGYTGATGFADDFKPYWKDPTTLQSLLDRHELSLAAVDISLRDDLQTYQPVLAMMREMDCRIMVCIDHDLATGDYATCASRLNRVAELAAEYAVDVHYHNHTAAVGETLADMERLLDLVDSDSVKLMLDVGHATKDFVELPPAERAVTFLERYWDRIHYIELKDWNEQTDLNTPLGEGYADYDRIFAMMRERGYSGWLTVEQNGNDGLSRGRAPKECARISRDFIRAGLGV
jgi:inosose dehydratase